MNERDRAELQAFLDRYVEACAEFAVEPLTEDELAELVFLIDEDLSYLRLH
jgi:hypothetical protein